MTIRTVETRKYGLAQGELVAVIPGDPPRAKVRVGTVVYEGVLVECLRKCTKDAEPYQ